MKAALAILAFASPLALHLAIVSENRAVMVVFLNLVVDFVYSLIDPRVRYS